MAEKTNFHQLLEQPEAPQIAADQKACLNCAHGRSGDQLPTLMRAQATNANFVLCKAGPPSVVPIPIQGSLSLNSRWPAMAPDEECDAFLIKKVDQKKPPGAY